MEFRQTSYQLARGARPDAETADTIILTKFVRRLRATYQIRMFLFRAVETGKRLVILLPEGARVDRSLRELLRTQPETIRVERRK